jgi:hypothetical protein
MAEQSQKAAWSSSGWSRFHRRSRTERQRAGGSVAGSHSAALHHVRWPLVSFFSRPAKLRQGTAQCGLTDEDAFALLPLRTELGQRGIGRRSNQLLQGGVLLGADLWLLATGIADGARDRHSCGVASESV